MSVEPETLFGYALAGQRCVLSGFGGADVALPVAAWQRDVDTDDLAMLDLCSGPTLDIGCGPGRMTAELAVRGLVALGIDVVPEAVGQTRERGGTALRRDVFEELPGEGRWRTALLADGNVGIGGDPVCLLRRVRSLLDPRGTAVVEVAGPGEEFRTVSVRISWGSAVSDPFPWSIVGVDELSGLADDAGLAVHSLHRYGRRWAAVLGEAP